VIGADRDELRTAAKLCPTLPHGVATPVLWDGGVSSDIRREVGVKEDGAGKDRLREVCVKQASQRAA
jgi:hypothetical protein